MTKTDFVITQEQANIRIDKVLAEYFPDKTRSYLQKLIKEEAVFINQNAVKSNYKVQLGDLLEITFPEEKSLNLEPEDLNLDIIYEDSDILIVNKPKGMVVHPSAGHDEHTLVHGILHHCQGQLSGINGVLRPGIVHRIDKDTTGVLVVCKNDKAHQSLAAQLKEHSITRKYRAIVFGQLWEDGTIEGSIGRHPVDRKKMAINERNGKHAVTHYHVIETFSKYTYVECQLETGRTHQIRVHMSSIGHPLLGDTIYGRQKQPFSLDGQTLHAMTLGFIHPSTNEYVEFQAPLPDYFQELLRKLR
ncbi:MAG: RluA family pseudouridine synthase [Lachnospiraceae bacterium]|nr:RluA family pseudouridine synthase [Lachnospiraceae bacterium]MDD3615851.1 RluA family pseudouridine synthase [Lachnospiraceae bacterium]